MDFMREMPDKAYNLAIVDPPYGIGINSQFKNSGGLGSKSMFRQTKGQGAKEWDSKTPTEEYFKELFRVSTNQIIWGGNYFLNHLPSTRCMLIWDKMNGGNNMADAEIAWTSIDGSVRMFRMHHFSRGYGTKIHLTQKPVALYTWLLKNYAKEGDKILDTHGGSMSSVIAAIKGGFDITCFELDKDYYEKAKERIENFISQENMFAEKPIITFS